MAISTYTVTGMTCGHCVAHVTEEVSALDGVTHVELALEGPMTVTADREIGFEEIVEAVSEAGNYTVTETK